MEIFKKQTIKLNTINNLFNARNGINQRSLGNVLSDY